MDDYSPADLAHASTIPSRWYFDPAMFRLEREKIFMRTWQPVGFAKNVAEAGSYFCCDVAGEPLLIVRGKDNVLRALSNVCRHRGSLIGDGAGKAVTLRCPYHNWTYALDGRLLACPEFEGVAGWDMNAVRLPEFRVTTWGPYVFVNLDANAPGMEEIFGNIPAEIAARWIGSNFPSVAITGSRATGRFTSTIISKATICRPRTPRCFANWIMPNIASIRFRIIPRNSRRSGRRAGAKRDAIPGMV